MNEKEWKELLTAYAREEMDALREEEMNGYDASYSKSHRRKIRRIMWSEKYFGKNIYRGYKLRRVASIVVIVMSTFLTVEVGARAFGINPWAYRPFHDSKEEMDGKTYSNIKEEPGDGAVVVRDLPTQIPEGYELTEQEEDDWFLYAEWRNNTNKLLEYDRTLLVEGMTIKMNAECKKYKVEICGYEGEYRVDLREPWLTGLLWDDTEYNHFIYADNLDNSREELIRMAESLYK